MEQSSGFLSVATASPSLKVADPGFNQAVISELARTAARQGVALLLLPELCLTAYTAGDLFFQQTLLDQAEAALQELARQSKDWGSLVLVAGLPLRHAQRLFNCACVIQAGQILAAVPKRQLPNSWEFYENRWFTSGEVLDGHTATITLGEHTVPLGQQLLALPLTAEDPLLIGIEICEDLWVPQPPSAELALRGARLILNPSASNELVGKSSYRRQLVQQQSGRLNAAYLYADAGPDESTTDLVFAGHSLIAENGRLLAETPLFAQNGPALQIAQLDLRHLAAERWHNKGFANQSAGLAPLPVVRLPQPGRCVSWAKLTRQLPPQPFVPADPLTLDERCREIFAIQAAGLAKRLRHTGARHAVIGISGGLDSTLALLVCCQAYTLLDWPLSDILGVTMPGFGTTALTHSNATRLMESLGVSVREISISAAVRQHFQDIGHDPARQDITYENSQARERTQILMDLANQVGGLVIGTGDLSELALGWCTYNADQISMYNVNVSIPKTLVKHLVNWRARQAEAAGQTETCRLLDSILATPISPELLPPDENGQIAQHTEATTGPYELHDFFLYYMLRFGDSPEQVFHLACQAFRDRPEYPPAVILKWLKNFYRRFFSQQFKRSCMP
ncbi:MAG: NAD(+) synthase, partial [Oscillospiraceae bacterium]|nr:NAD(+) synthase [Oscillospiraceae bacterium]